jgi:hypothetical protein
MNDGDKEDFKSFRKNVADSLGDACAIIGGTKCLELLNSLLDQQMLEYSRNYNQNSGSKPDWRPLEATLYCIRSIGRYVNKKKSPHVIPNVMSNLLQLPPEVIPPSYEYLYLLYINPLYCSQR